MAFDLIRDIANYGSNLIPRCFSSGDKGLKDAVMLEPYHKPKNAHLHGICVDCGLRNTDSPQQPFTSTL